VKKLLFLCVLMIVIVVGCSSGEFTTENLETIYIYELEDGNTELKASPDIIIKDSKGINNFIKALNNSEEHEGLNITPNYRLEVTNSVGTVFLYLDEKQGEFLRPNYDEVSYILSDKSVKILNGLLN
jgi:hypothetical protein